MKRVPNTPDTVPDSFVLAQNAREMEQQADDGRPLTLREFISLNIPPPKPLLGTVENCYLAEGGIAMLASEPHVGKTTLALDLIAHLASGTEWLGIHVERPVRILLLENEGPMAMFQRQVRKKIASWEGDDFADHVTILTNKWGDWSLREERDREYIKGYCKTHAIDLVIGDTLGTLGVDGNGSPAETRAFQDLVRQAGLGAQAWLLLHHFNRTAGVPALSLNRLSGDWGKWPDTIAYLEGGGLHVTKLGWPKTRFVDDKPEGWSILKWVLESRSFAVAGRDEKGEETYEAAVLEYLTHRNLEGPTTREIIAAKLGKTDGVHAALKSLADAGKIVNRGSPSHSRWYAAPQTDEDRDAQIMLAIDRMPDIDDLSESA
jgi:hypothetical protein